MTPKCFYKELNI